MARLQQWWYIARARRDLDADVLSGILVGVFMVARLAFGRALKSRQPMTEDGQTRLCSSTTCVKLAQAAHKPFGI